MFGGVERSGTGVSFLSFLILCMAYFIEFGLGHKPCNLCILQRIPYAAAVVLLPFSIIFHKFKKALIMVVTLLFLIGSLISFYHFGIEQGFFEESPVCKNRSNLDIFDKEKLLIELQKNSVSCKNVTFSIFGFSLATINTFVSFLISFITMRAFYNYEKKQ